MKKKQYLKPNFNVDYYEGAVLTTSAGTDGDNFVSDGDVLYING